MNKLKQTLFGVLSVAALVGASLISNMPNAPKASAVTQAHIPPHYVLNQGPTVPEQTAAAALGFNYMDVASKAVMDLLPTGTKGLYYVGNGYNTTCSWTVSDAQLTTIVQNNMGDSHFSGIYYISDEPHSLTCPGGPQALADRTALIKSIDPSAKTFAVIQWNATTNEYSNFSNSVDYIGTDPYPCNVNNQTSCDFTSFTSKIQQAVTSVGASRIVPVFQTFGQTCNTGSSHFYRLPSATELQTMLNTYDQLVPTWVRPFDATYGWRNQTTACPTLKDANGTNGYPDLQTVMSAYFTNMQPVTVAVGPSADTYVTNTYANNNFGAQTTMCADKDTTVENRPLLKFTVSGVGSRTVLSADLALHTYNGTATTVNLRKVDDQTWTETAVTWNNQPTAGTVVATIPSATTGSTVHVDLTSLVTADGTYTVELEGTSPDAYCVDTKETTTGTAPLLTIVAQK